MGTTISSLQSLPPLKSFLLPTPETYALAVNAFQYFPIVLLPPSWSLGPQDTIKKKKDRTLILIFT